MCYTARMTPPAYTTQQLTQWIAQAAAETCAHWARLNPVEGALSDSFMFPNTTVAGICAAIPRAKCLMITARPGAAIQEGEELCARQDLTFFAAQVDDVVFWRGQPCSLEELGAEMMRLASLGRPHGPGVGASWSVEAMDESPLLAVMAGPQAHHLAEAIAARIQAHEQALALEAESSPPLSTRTRRI